jgi:hypothetical protein
MAKTVEELLNTPGDQIKPPPLLPVGTYLVGIVGQPEMITSTQKQTPGCAIKYKFWQARDDVDADDLQAILAESGQTLNDVEMTDTFYFTEKSLFMFKQFYANALDIPQSYSPKQAMAEMPGKQLLIHIRHRPRQDGSGLYAEIDTRTRAPRWTRPNALAEVNDARRASALLQLGVVRSFRHPALDLTKEALTWSQEMNKAINEIKERL